MTAASVARTAGLYEALQRVDALEEEARHRALHDALTGLANRALFVDRVDDALARAARDGGTTAVLGLDIDRFKVVNDRHGHGRGDELLSELARRLAALLPAGDTLARLGGDEFAVLCEGRPGERGAIEIAQRLLGGLTTPIVLGEHPVFVDASVGIAVSDGRHVDAEAVLRDAGAAMSRAKDAGGARYELFDPALSRGRAKRLELEDDLRHALERGELELYYQPLVDLDERRIVASRDWCAGATRAGASCYPASS